ncbi:hypothetical protein JXA56_04215, partial [Candidatus Micrarchaeota archaeon]|nr:hypothetical protein [Candidatus Micrarchaeota archaeon]
FCSSFTTVKVSSKVRSFFSSFWVLVQFYCGQSFRLNQASGLQNEVLPIIKCKKTGNSRE